MRERTANLGVVAAALSADAREAARLSRAAGFSGVLFDAFGAGLDVTTLSQTGRREFRHLLSGSDQALIGLRVDVGPKGFGPGADIDRLLRRFEQVMEAAKGLGAPLVCVEAGPLPEPAATEKPRPAIAPDQAGLLIIPSPAPPPPAPAQESRPVPGPDPRVVSSVDTAMFELGARADRIGVTVAFRSELSSCAALERALAAARCPWFGVDLDPVAILRDAWPSDEIFSRLGNLIRHARGRDATAGSDRRTQPAVIGRGSTDWPALLASLDAAGYRNWITIDPLELTDRAGAAAAGAAHLAAAGF